MALAKSNETATGDDDNLCWFGFPLIKKSLQAISAIRILQEAFAITPSGHPGVYRTNPSCHEPGTWAE